MYFCSLQSSRYGNLVSADTARTTDRTATGAHMKTPAGAGAGFGVAVDQGKRRLPDVRKVQLCTFRTRCTRTQFGCSSVGQAQALGRRASHPWLALTGDLRSPVRNPA